MKPIQITSLAHLRAEINSGHHEYFVLFGGGPLRSSKTIHLHNRRFGVFASISGCFNWYTTRELRNETVIPKAIAAGAFYRD